MKCLISLMLLVVFIQFAFAQNKTFGVGTNTLNPNAALQVDATNQGLQLPRLTTSQRTGMTLTNTDKGLVVFDTDLNAVHTWNGSAWTNGQKLPFPYKDSLAVDPGAGDAFFHLVNASNQLNADVIKGVMKGTGGAAGSFILRNAASTKPAVYGETIGTASAGFFKVNNAAAGGTAIVGTTNSNVGGLLAPVGVYGESTGTGSVGGAFWNTNVDNTYSPLYAQTNGTGPGLIINQNGAAGDLAQFRSNNTTKVTIGKDGHVYNFSDNSWAAFQSANSGDGFAGAFWIDKVTSNNTALYAETHGTGVSIAGGTSTGWTAIKGTNSGTGNGGFFSIENPASTNSAIYAETNGTGSGGNFAINNGSSSSAGVYGTTNGTGSGVTGQTATGFAGVYARNEGTSGAGLQADHVGTNGSAGSFNVSNASNTAPAIFASTVGAGAAMHGVNTGEGYAAYFNVTNTSSGAPVTYTAQQGIGRVAVFSNFNSANSTEVIKAQTNGTGAVLSLDQIGISGDIALFKSNTINVARIDKNGIGFFNGGTQNSGADVAELFDVEGNKQEYEPGDVLVISESTDRTVEKSSNPNSTKVVGVYATKPGVMLTEKGIEENLDDLVPMGVIGVIPTKVCDENGPIKRGDLLVTSSVKGHAMKAISAKGDGIYPAGVIIGKALENFETGDRGLIKVLVNIK